MYRIIIYNPDGTRSTLYDPAGTGILPVLGPRSTEELNEPGSLEFSLVYGHPAYDLIEPKKTYISAELNGTEFFYGRVLNADPSPMTGQTQYTAAGALSFLKDSEVPPDPKKSDGTTDYQTMTAEAFFRRCIAAHNADVGSDTRRQFTVGIVSHSRKDEQRQYQLTSYQDTRSVLEQNLLENYGGFLRTRRANGVLYIDWVETYGDTDTGELALGQNIISLLNRMAADELYTAIRPIGKDGITLSGNNGLIYLYPTEQMAEYGVIVRSVTFNDADTQASLQTKAEALVNRLQKSLVITSEIKLLDMKFVDGLSHGVNLGDVFTQIAGLEGKPMIVGARNRDFENPQNDSCTLRNPKSYEGGSNPESTASTLSQKTSRNSAAGGYAYKYIHEFNERLELNTKNIAINAEELELHAETLVETANEFQRISRTEGLMDDRLNAIEGTGVIQNSEAITNVAGKFRVNTDPETGESTVELLEGATLRIEKNGIYSDVVNEDQMHSSIEQTADAISLAVADATTDLYSTIRVTATNVYSEVWNRTSSTFSTIEQTSEMVRAEVGTAVSGIAHSVIEQTATYIHMEVANAASSITESVIEQTSDYVRTTVSEVASGIAWSVVEQTMTGIYQEVGRKATTYRQWSDPNDGTRVIRDGDIWVKVRDQRTWNDVSNMTWEDISDRKWNEQYSGKMYTWNETKGDWVLVVDTAPIVESKTWVEQDSERYAILAHQLDTNGQAYDSNLTVTAQKISTEVNAANSNLYSTIAQTATNITARVENVREGLQSSIEQTAQSIRTSTSAAYSRLYSTIEQTATSIRSEVANTVSDLRSSIEQTAESVTIAVTAAKSDMGSLIKSTATNIYSTVWNRTTSTYSTIQQTADKIELSVNAAKSDLGSVIRQTSTSIYSAVWNRTTGTYSTITQTDEKIQSAVSAADGNLKSLIRQTSTNIYSSVWNKTTETYSTFEQTDSRIRAMVVDENIGNYSTILETSTSIALSVAGAESRLRSAIQVQSDRISLVVESSDPNAKITPASIVAAVNNSGSSVRINADKVTISGATTLNGVMSVANETVTIKKSTYIQGNVVMNTAGSVLTAPMLQTGYNGKVRIVGSSIATLYDLDAATVGGMVKTATLSGNTLKLTKFDGTDITFSKATTLSGNWNGGIFEVNASPQGNKITTGIFDLTSSDISWNGNVATISLYANKDGGETKLYTGKQLTVSIPLETKSITSNGSYTPSSGKVGFSSVSVSVPSNVTYFRTWAAAEGTTIPQVNWSNNASGYHIISEGSNGSAGIIVGADVQVNNGSTQNVWDYLQTAPTALYRYAYSNGYSAGYTDGGNYGRSQVTLNDPTWNAISGSTPDHRTITVKTSGRRNASGQVAELEKSATLYLTKGSWTTSGSSSTLYVSMRTGSTSGTTYASTSVSSSVSDLGAYKPNATSVTTSEYIRSSTTYETWCKLNGAWVQGSSITVTPNFTDKGGSWYCTITTGTTGIKTCRLTRSFGASQSVPFTNETNYHLYT